MPNPPPARLAATARPAAAAWPARHGAAPAWALACALAAALPARADEARRNWYHDPFEQVTHGLPGCPVPEGPLMTEREADAQAHWRVERGTSCYRDGRCRLPNAYLYDKEIAPRVKRAIDADGGFADTRVWVMVQRRWVWLQGCVARPAQARALERLVRDIDDVEQVLPQLLVGTTPAPGQPVPYPVLAPDVPASTPATPRPDR